MGIRFHCPNGHHLNVKSYLAGKRGFCPRCGVPVDIPLVDDPGEPLGEGSVFLPTTSSTPAATAADSAESAPASDAAAAPETTENQSQNVDPLSEAPDAAWYVRSPAGGQYGPASRDVLRQWLGEGRIGAESLLWRDGWPEWRLASELFPALPKTTEVEPPSITTGENSTMSSSPATTDGAESVGRRRRRSNDMAMWAVIVLAITSVLLFGALLYVVVIRG